MWLPPVGALVTISCLGRDVVVVLLAIEGALVVCVPTPVGGKK